MLESGGEVGDGGLGVSAAGHGGVEVMSELTQPEDSWGELFDVAAEGAAGDSDEVFGEGDAGVAVGVFMLERGSVGALVGAVVRLLIPITRVLTNSLALATTKCENQSLVFHPMT